MKFRFNIVVQPPPPGIAKGSLQDRIKAKNAKATTIHGVIEVDPKDLSLGDLEKALEVEAYLERLTGLRFHIEQAG